jgi:hypothetical protein
MVEQRICKFPKQFLAISRDGTWSRSTDETSDRSITRVIDVHISSNVVVFFSRVLPKREVLYQVYAHCLVRTESIDATSSSWNIAQSIGNMILSEYARQLDCYSSISIAKFDPLIGNHYQTSIGNYSLIWFDDFKQLLRSNTFFIVHDFFNVYPIHKFQVVVQ